MTDPHPLFVRLVALGTQFPWEALEAAVQALEEGRDGQYRDNPELWRTLSPRVHRHHGQEHWYKAIVGKTDENHVAHMVARWMMCAETLVTELNETSNGVRNDGDRQETQV